MKKYAIIVAGGTGSRMGTEVPKQFLLLAGKPVLMHTIDAFSRFEPEIKIIVVLHPNFYDHWHKLCADHNFSIKHVLAQGGAMRYHSVKNGLELIDSDGLVAVHDAARPLISFALINRLFSEAITQGSAIPALPVTDTIRTIEGGRVHIVDRTFLRTIQTPQVFRIGLLKEAYDQPYQNSFTDDAAVLEALGKTIHLTDGEPQNIKITHPVDLLFAEAFLNGKASDISRSV
jgi:2-C-methyl-D-erythritol 4-phosphate cytidylyltransferase